MYLRFQLEMDLRLFIEIDRKVNQKWFSIGVDAPKAQKISKESKMAQFLRIKKLEKQSILKRI